MSEVRKMRVVVSVACTGVMRRLVRLLPDLRVSAELLSVSREELASTLNEAPVEALILGPEDFDLAAELSERSYTGVLILTEGEEQTAALAPACCAVGVLVAPQSALETALPQLLALCTRLRSLRARTNTLRRQLDDTRLVSRAKLLLMSRFKMSEGEAHRYIEKAAMDAGAKRRDIAERIIRTYEE